MKVSELIIMLQECDPDKEIVLRGYEGGILNASGTKNTTIRLNVHTEWYYGPHEEIENYYGDTPDKYDTAECVLIG